MNKLKLVAFATLALASIQARAQIIDFVQMTEASDGLGESAWSTLALSYADFDLDITATKKINGVTSDAYAYLDWSHAGLGVCGDAGNGNGSAGVTRQGLRTNICNPGSDDNVTVGETLYFSFNRDVRIDKLWLNNTHDPDRHILPDDHVLINGSPVAGEGNGYAPTTSYSGYSSSPDNFLSSFFVAANTQFSIAYGDEQFYISGMEVTAVPEPGTLALLGIGLAGLGFSRRLQSRQQT